MRADIEKFQAQLEVTLLQALHLLTLTVDSGDTGYGWIWFKIWFVTETLDMTSDITPLARPRLNLSLGFTDDIQHARLPESSTAGGA